MTTPPTPAGWYPDPDGAGGQRYWDGSTWTEHRSPGTEATTVVRTRSAPTEEHVGAHRAPEPEPEPSTQVTEPVTQRVPLSGPPPSAPPPSAPPAPSAPGDNRKLIVWYSAACAGLLAVLVLVVVYGLFLKDDDAAPTAASPTNTTTAETAPTTTGGSGWGEPTETGTAAPTKEAESPEASDGPLSFAVWGVETGPTVVSQDAPIEKTAQGEYIVVRLTITNTSDTPATFLGTLQKLVAPGGPYSIDDEATFYIGGGLAELAPGDQADVSVAFDVPPGTQPEAIELHADPLSPGVQVPLT